MQAAAQAEEGGCTRGPVASHLGRQAGDHRGLGWGEFIHSHSLSHSLSLTHTTTTTTVCRKREKDTESKRGGEVVSQSSHMQSVPSSLRIPDLPEAPRPGTGERTRERAQGADAGEEWPVLPPAKAQRLHPQHHTHKTEIVILSISHE